MIRKEVRLETNLPTDFQGERNRYRENENRKGVPKKEVSNRQTDRQTDGRTETG